jgi:transposase
MKKIKTKDDVLKIKAMRAAGFTSRQIADVMGVKPRAVFYWVRRMKEDGIDAPTTAVRGSARLKLN